jgi:hypothetical protein
MTTKCVGKNKHGVVYSTIRSFVSREWVIPPHLTGHLLDLRSENKLDPQFVRLCFSEGIKKMKTIYHLDTETLLRREIQFYS